MKNDPKKMTSKFPGTCIKCRKPIKKGETIIYYPLGKSVFCEPCGTPEYNFFLTTKQDEEIFNRF